MGYVGVPGVISLYLVWWLTGWVGEKLDRIIQLLEQIARALCCAPEPPRSPKFNSRRDIPDGANVARKANARAFFGRGPGKGRQAPS